MTFVLFVSCRIFLIEHTQQTTKQDGRPAADLVNTAKVYNSPSNIIMSTLIFQRKRQNKIRGIVPAKRFIVDDVERTPKEGDKKENISLPQTVGSADTTNGQVLEVVKQSAQDVLDVGVERSYDWIDIVKENLCLQKTQFYSQKDATTLLTLCERELVYNEGDLATVKLFGRRIQIPRKQVR